MLLPEGAGDFHILSGGAQERSHRAGTEDVAGVLAMLAALDASTPGEPAGRDFFIGRLSAAIPGSRVLAVGAPRLWNTVSLIMPAHPGVRWIRTLEKAGFLLGAGSACSTGKAGVSPVLLEMGIDPVAAGRVLRISSGTGTSKEDWRALADALAAARETLDQESEASNGSVISIP
jgi:cysteine desulfurase